MRPLLVAIRVYLLIALVVAGVVAVVVTVLFLAIAYPIRLLTQNPFRLLTQNRLGACLGSLRERSGAYRPTDAERAAGVFQPEHPHARSLDSFQNSGARN